ncbi:MBL fold metallo-hydrolase [Faecalibaculum rodentium]|uniref:MBL fold metallo-hydrolase n=1 Tax=Faecalibaculum rodentium TaxID=1702221 RepID=UPI0023F3A2DE|nr:MBL fold metallo-hydrolase [Faecalibaculum rodentium]
MAVTLFFLTIGIWISCVLSDPWLVTGFAGLWGLVLWIRMKKPAVCIFWGVLSLTIVAGILWNQAFPEPDPRPGLYQVYEVRAGYVLAANGSSRILYQDQEANIHDELYIENLEPLTGLKNLHLFDFADSMAAKGVRWRGTGYIRTVSDSLQGRLMRYVRNSPAKMAAFYGIREKDSLLVKAGLPVLAFLMVFENLLRRRMKPNAVHFCLLPPAILWGWLFLWPAALMRWVLFRLIRLSGLQPLAAWSLSVLLFLILQPEKAASFSLVFPALLQLCSITRRRSCTRYLMALLQILYFGSLSCTLFSGYSLLRLLSAASFALAFFDISLEIEWMLPEIPIPAAPVLLVVAAILLLRYMIMQKHPQLLLCSLLIMPVSPYLDPFFHVYMLDIGQGDCTLVVEPFCRSAVMIDAAGNLYRDNAESVILPFLEAAGIRKLDALIVSHEDFDHAGAVEAVQDSISVHTVIRDPTQPVPVEYPMLNLLPDRTSPDENEGSLLTYFSYDGHGYFWPGDAGILTEKLLMDTFADLPVTVLKAGHHGSASASCPAFLEWLSPDLVLLSAGRNNRYGHPSPEVITSLQSMNTARFCTAESGMIHLASWHGFLFLETAEGQVSCLSTPAGR